MILGIEIATSYEMLQGYIFIIQNGLPEDSGYEKARKRVEMIYFLFINKL